MPFSIETVEKIVNTLSVISESGHYARNNLTVPPISYSEALTRPGVTRASDKETAFHRIGEGNESNVKFIDENGNEWVFRPNDDGTHTLLTLENDPINAGTYNYGPDPQSYDHLIYDIFPWVLWGNTPDQKDQSDERLRQAKAGFNELLEADWTDDVADDFSDAELIRLIDPIVLDLDGNGIELTGRANSNVYFDMDGDGIKELTGWVSPTDGLLAIDGNSNGKIDSINELIGDPGRSGFAELITYDRNNDRVINSRDAAWSQLRVWVDANSDGVTDAGELRTLASLNIRAIDLNYTAVNFTAEGNRIHEQSVFEYTNGTTGLVADIWFDVSNLATDSDITLTGNVTIDNLPDIRGRGDVESLRSVMLTDGALTTLVSGFVAQNLSNLGNARSQVEQIVYRWTGVQAVDPASRGGFMDGRKLAALEEFLGTEYLVQGISNPNAAAAARLTAAWNGLVDGILSRLLMSGPLGDAVADSAVYVPEIDLLLTVQTPEELFDSFRNAAPVGDGLVVAGYWAAVLPLVREIVQDVGGDTGSQTYSDAVNAALLDTGLAPFADLLDDGIVPLSAFSSVLRTEGVFRLTSGGDTLWLGAERHAIFADSGNDFVAVSQQTAQSQLIDGGAGNDQLFGSAGDDALDGGAGLDTMVGGAGDDTYTVDNVGDVVTEGADSGEDHVRSSVAYVLGADLEHLTLLGAGAVNGTGNASANRITGNSGANRLEGLAGNDTLDGGGGNDTMVGGTGADLYRVDAAGDVIIETGSDTDTVESSVNHTLGAKLENLVLISGAVNGTGNGANNTLWGNALGNTLNGGAGADTMYGGAGSDTYVVDHTSDYVQEENAAGTDRVQSSISYSLGSYVENLILTGSQDIDGTGNELANQITGNTGDNLIDGGTGADTMVGGAGDDTYAVDVAGDVVTEVVDGGTDRVQTALAAYTLGANVENLQLFVSWDDGGNRNGTGNELGNEIEGTSGVNRLTGLAGNDTLYGGAGTDSLYGGENDDHLDGGSERDQMEGGIGNDRYIVDVATDVVVEALNAGTDTVESSVSWILGANLENLRLTGASWVAADGQGNGLNNQLIGNAANNALDGGAGLDTMVGGAGDDTYTVDNVGDVVTEGADSGEDHVRSSVAYVLGADLEHLTLLGAGAVNGTGNASANRITGNSGANRLEGLAGNDTLDGGGGNDTMVGGTGADLYRVDAAGDVIIETGSDTDTVESSVNHTLGAKLENLVLISGAVNGTGNGANNTLWGNALGNTLNGGAGADTMYGGAGSDTYVVDHTSDYVQEENAAGTDRVQSSISYSLGSYVENLILTGSQDIDGTGNELANQITGNTGDNLIDGGTGADTMVGGAGDDTYAVDVAGDVVTEVVDGGTDRVQTALAAYTLGANVENLQLFVSWDDGGNRNGTGNELGNEIEGTSGVNRLTGLAGNDTLYGGAGTDSLYGGENDDHLDGGSERDQMEGGIGNDRYIVDVATDVVVEALNAGTDTVESSVSWILGANLENLRLTGASWVAADGQGNGLNNQLIGNAANNALDGGAGLDTMVGGAGDDTYTVDNVGDVVTEGADSGEDHVRSSVAYVLGADLEHLTLLGAGAVNGTGNASANRITGNSGANRLEGLAGNDTLDGGGGNDTMVGGTGADLYRVDAAGDVIIETGSDTDTVESSVNHTLGAKLENLVLISGAVNGTGNGANNTLWGNALGNTLNGGAGADTMYGGAGSDTYVVDHTSDYVQEENAAGTDRVQSSISYSLGSYVENLILTGSQDIDGTGNELANQITGNTGDNLIDGGTGADTMVGGAGDDTYAVDVAGDVVTEVVDGGTDRVQTALAAYTLGANVENLQLFVSWDDGGNRNGTGNELGNEIEGTSGVNRLTGLAGNDTLYGGAGTDSLYGGENDDHLDGGSERDQMEGGIGNDRYIVDVATDVVVEALNAGTDTVESSVSWILGANLENLRLTGASWVAADGQGNGLNNQLIGNAANNALDGGAGLDTMVGGAGDDTYTVDNVGDVVTELPGSGNDTVRSSISSNLGNFIENLTLIGSSNITAIGNVSDNVVSGNAGVNTITGGLGRDTLFGGAGADTFVFGALDTGADTSSADLISDFNSAQGDRINMSAIDALPSTAADNAFLFIGSANFNTVGQARSAFDGSRTYIYFNTDTDFADAEFVIGLSGNVGLTATDFIL